jgi:sulfate permease, SulP family
LAYVLKGVLVGVLLSLGGHLARNARPHIAVLGRMPDIQTFRNVLRYKVETQPHLLLRRVDASLFFGNAAAITARHEELVTASTCDLVLDMSAVNSMGFSAHLALCERTLGLGRRGVRLHLSALKGSVNDHLVGSQLLAKLSRSVYQTTGQAYLALAGACAEQR